MRGSWDYALVAVGNWPYMRFPTQLLICLCCWLATPLAAGGERLHVAVAANFRAPLLRILPAFPAADAVRLSSASSGALYAQIVNGAPYAIYLSADSLRPSLLERQGLAVEGSRRTYAFGLLAMAYQPRLAGLARAGPGALLRRQGGTLAIANPQLAPYGVAAMEVLQRFPGHRGEILRGANIAQAYQLWHGGGADLALLARSQAPASALPVAEAWHGPIEQQMVILKAASDNPLARQFADWLFERRTRRAIARQGYRTEMQ